MSQMNSVVPVRPYFEDVLPETGWGLYYKFMLGMACACSFTHATAFLTIPFCIPLSTCEHGITKEILLGLHTSFTLVFAILMKSPAIRERRTVDMTLTTWRMIFAISGGLNLTLACATALLEESPRYFMHAKKNYLALLTLKQFYAINKSSYGESFQVLLFNIYIIIEQ
ncbi:hypothetical protein NQ314_019738 [Rhamnusium bicolor]|uniref:Uncharacterized protein n=1 Tax=Rhamnusium bicolor TaxID=1586634 RepID=A0AAV8WN61_9CUCU|nr:hypothetical protein NQ314_019738 [Rhamnusium bicolor]